jgi:thioredoxin-like negative regulator of GroEL
VAETELVAAMNTPREPGVRIQVARGLIQAQQARRALEILAPAEQQVQGTLSHAEVLALQAEAHIALGANADASRTLTTLVQNFPESAGQPRIRLQLGLLSEEAGVIQRARTYYRAIVEDTPTSPEAKVAQQRLDDLKGL